MGVSLFIIADGHFFAKNKTHLLTIKGKTLLEHVCEKVRLCQSVYNISLLVHDEQSIELINSKKYTGPKINIIKAPWDCEEMITLSDRLMFLANSVETEEIISVTTPLTPILSPKIIDDSIMHYREKRVNNRGKSVYDSFFSVTQTQNILWEKNKKDKKLTNHSESIFYEQSRALLGVDTETLFKNKKWLTDKPLLIKIPKLEALDIGLSSDIPIIKRFLASPKPSHNKDTKKQPGQLKVKLDQENILNIDDSQNFDSFVARFHNETQ